MEQVHTDLSPEQRPEPQSFNSQVRDLITDLEDTVKAAQKEIDGLYLVLSSGGEQRRLARQATEVKRAITLLKESILS